ncbi:MAG: radical SAM protein [Victivallales bacterium]|nr:radical SAM protein [Victivallales bacterium]
MRILLISTNTEELISKVYPVGLWCVADYLIKRNHTVKTYVFQNEKNNYSNLKKTILEFKPELIGFSIRNIDNISMERPRLLLETDKETVAYCRNYFKGSIVLGGAGYSIFPDEILEYLKADYGISGFNLSYLNELIKKLSKHDQNFKIPNLRIRNSPEAKNVMIKLKDARDLNIPSPIHFEEENISKNDTLIPIFSHLGCPMDCIYCTTKHLEGLKIIPVDHDRIIQSIRNYNEAGYSNFKFIDGVFNFPKNNCNKLCRRIIDERINIRYECTVYPWKVDEETVQLLAESGCSSVTLSLESGSDPILKSLNKKYTKRDVRQASQLISRYGINQNGFLLFGSPGENSNTVKESLDFAETLNFTSLSLGIGIRIYPHTRLYNIALEEGVITENESLLKPRFYISKSITESDIAYIHRKAEANSRCRMMQ